MKIDDGGEAFLLESVEGGEKWGRYSFLGTSPMAVIKSKGRTVEIAEGQKTRVEEGDPLELLKGFMSRYRAADVKGASRFFGGAIGHIGYDFVRYIERLPDLAPRDLDLHELFFIITDTFVVFDNMEHKIIVVCNAGIRSGKCI
jgi:anthranilate synthase component 1